MSKRFSFLHRTFTEFERDLRDLCNFARDILKYRKLTSLHVQWFSDALMHQYLLFLAPRGHFKTTVLTTCYSLWRLCKDRNLRIGILNETLGVAKTFLREQKDHIRHNQDFRNLYGHWDAEADRWNDFEIKIPRTEIRKESSIAISSAEGAYVSNHPDLLIIDDPNSTRNTETMHQRSKMQKWFRSVIVPALMPHTQVIIPMTRWHVDDLAGYIIRTEERRRKARKRKKWHIVKLAAEWKDEKTGEQKILFPEIFTPEHLEDVKDDMGPMDYRLQMLNDPSTDGGDFKESWLVTYKTQPERKGLDVYVGFDIAIGKNDRNSKFAYTVLGKDEYGNVFLLEARKERVDFPSQINLVKRAWRVWLPHLIMVENNAYQEALLQMIRTDPEAQLMPLKGTPSTGDKRRRLNSMAPLFEKGVIRVPEDCPDFYEEYRNFPNGEMDLLDSMHLAMRGMHEQPVEPRIIEV